MPRPAAPPRLYLRDRRGRTAVWVILHNGREISTGAAATNNGKAHAAFADYLGRTHVPQFGSSDPAQILIADVLATYAEQRAPRTRRRDLIAGAIRKLDEFFGERTCATITAAACNDYVDWRTDQASKRSKIGARIKPASAGRELVVLSAALHWAWKNRLLDRPLSVTFPPRSPRRERHLSRSEAARLIAGALGFYQVRWSDRASRREHARWQRNPDRINRHVARFILLGLYTGTRHDAILQLQWQPNTAGGHVDLADQVLYRRAGDSLDTSKRRPPLPLPPRLLPHLQRWQRMGDRHLVEWNGAPIASQERRGFAGARELAGLDAAVTPHILRHTFATWLLQSGASVYDVAGALGASEAVVRATYGHHAKDRMRATVAAFSRRRG